MARKKSTAAAADPTVEPTTPATDLGQTEEPTKKQMTAEEKRAAQLATLARARAIWSESCKAGTAKNTKTMTKKEALGQAMGDLSKIAARLQKNNLHEVADRLRGEIARIGAALTEVE